MEIYFSCLPVSKQIFTNDLINIWGDKYLLLKGSPLKLLQSLSQYTETRNNTNLLPRCRNQLINQINFIAVVVHFFFPKLISS